MSYLERYITKEDFDMLDTSNFNDTLIRISSYKENNYTEKIYVYDIDKYRIAIHGHYIIKSKQNYGFIKKEALSPHSYMDIKLRKSENYSTKIFLPEIFVNPEFEAAEYHIGVFCPNHIQREFLFDYNNKLKPNLQISLRM